MFVKSRSAGACKRRMSNRVPYVALSMIPDMGLRAQETKSPLSSIVNSLHSISVK